MAVSSTIKEAIKERLEALGKAEINEVTKFYLTETKALLRCLDDIVDLDSNRYQSEITQAMSGILTILEHTDVKTKGSSIIEIQHAVDRMRAYAATSVHYRALGNRVSSMLMTFAALALALHFIPLSFTMLSLSVVLASAAVISQVIYQGFAWAGDKYLSSVVDSPAHRFLSKAGVFALTVQKREQEGLDTVNTINVVSLSTAGTHTSKQLVA